MSGFLVSGLMNLEVTLQVDRFPIEYQPVRYPFFGINSGIGGTGYNLAKALTVLGNEVRFLSIIGSDAAGLLAKTELLHDGINSEFVTQFVGQTPQSVILYDGEGQRQINTDLKDIPERYYREEFIDRALIGVSRAVLCNVNCSRPLLEKARTAGIPIATDVHAIASLDDDYNRDFLASAEILFLSDERLPCTPETWVKQCCDRYGTEIIVVGLGSEGALLWVKRDRFLERFTAVQIRPVVNTVGAGDALFASFLHAYQLSGDPYQALQKAVLFTAYKIGEPRAAAGFLTAAELETLYCDSIHRRAN